jgi:hypothetical protein
MPAARTERERIGEQIREQLYVPRRDKTPRAR